MLTSFGLLSLNLCGSLGQHRAVMILDMQNHNFYLLLSCFLIAQSWLFNKKLSSLNRGEDDSFPMHMEPPYVLVLFSVLVLLGESSRNQKIFEYGGDGPEYFA